MRKKIEMNLRPMIHRVFALENERESGEWFPFLFTSREEFYCVVIKDLRIFKSQSSRWCNKNKMFNFALIRSFYIISFENVKLSFLDSKKIKRFLRNFSLCKKYFFYTWTRWEEIRPMCCRGKQNFYCIVYDHFYYITYVW